MNTQQAIMAFSQSEKIKAGIIWISSLLELLGGLLGPEKQGGQQTILTLSNMVFQEIQLARNITGDREWENIMKDMDQALNMIHSGVGSESVTLLTKALSKVTNIGQQSMMYLRENKLL